MKLDVSEDVKRRVCECLEEEYEGPLTVSFKIVDVRTAIWSGGADVKVRASIVHHETGDTLAVIDEKWLSKRDRFTLTLDMLSIDQVINVE